MGIVEKLSYSSLIVGVVAFELPFSHQYQYWDYETTEATWWHITIISKVNLIAAIGSKAALTHKNIC